MRKRLVRCAGRSCGREWRTAKQDPECSQCGADAFDANDGLWPEKCPKCKAEHVLAEGCP